MGRGQIVFEPFRVGMKNREIIPQSNLNSKQSFKFTLIPRVVLEQ
jgi:hypothetical protein